MGEADETALRCVRLLIEPDGVERTCAAPLPLGARYCPACGIALNDSQRRTSDFRLRARRPSLSHAVFADLAGDYATRLRKLRRSTDHDRALVELALELEAKFRSFAVTFPSHEDEGNALTRFTELNRAALDRLDR